MLATQLAPPVEVILRSEGRTLRIHLPDGWKLRRANMGKKGKERIEASTATGEVVELHREDWIRCECRGCRHTFLVNFNSGALRCPHCGDGVDAQWGKAEIHFAPIAGERFSSVPPTKGDG